MAAKQKNPKVVTIYGRLSFPSFTAQEAYDLSQKGDYPASSVAEAAPSFQLLVEERMLNKLRDHMINEFFPYCVEQSAKKEKKDALTDKEVKLLVEQLNDPEFEGTFNIPFRPVHEKSAELAPEAAATVKLLGNKGVDTELMAIVNDESELAVPDPDILKFPVIKPIHQTVHSMYPGAIVAVTVNLYAYHNGKNPGCSAGASTAVFKADAERFGGGTAVDEDEIFMD